MFIELQKTSNVNSIGNFTSDDGNLFQKNGNTSEIDGLGNIYTNSNYRPNGKRGQATYRSLVVIQNTCTVHSY